MELHMHSHRWEARTPDWTAAAVSGFVAGAMLMVLEFFWSTMVLNVSPWAISHMVAAIVAGPQALQTADFSYFIVGIALVTHYALGVVFGMILAGIIAPFHFDSSTGMVLLVGAVFGLCLYLFNFYGMHRLFPWFGEIRGAATLLSQILFGMASALLYMKLERRDK